MLDLGVLSSSVVRHFQFDASWLLVDGFCDLISGKIQSLLSSRARSFGPMDDWHFCSYQLRKFLKGWGHNRAAEARKHKTDLAEQVSALDAEADVSGLSEAGWQQRYALEELVM